MQFVFNRVGDWCRRSLEREVLEIDGVDGIGGS